MTDMSTKSQNSDTSEERVQETDKSIHDDDDIQEYKKPWVSLTDEEIAEIQYSTGTQVEYELFDEGEYGTEINIYPEKFARAIEAKLKEKNT